MNQLLEALAETELLRDASNALLEKVLAHASPVQLEPGEVLLSPERHNAHVYLLLEGTLSVHFNTPDSPVMRTLTQGDSAGEMSVIDDAVPSAYVKASGRCLVFPLHRDFLLAFIRDTHPVAHNLLRSLTRLLKGNTQIIINEQYKISELTTQANMDGLTGLYNRRWLDNALPRIVTQMANSAQPLCILMIDVDHFKNYNDLQGHPGGDLALRGMGNILKSTVRPHDFVARYGGEEFMVVLPNTTHAAGVTLAERIRRNTEDYKITQPDGAVLPGITVSIGLAAAHDNATAESLVAAADAQLYAAKQSGRNRVKYSE